MALSLEKLLTDAHTLIIDLKDHDSVADNIIASTQALFTKVEAMKQYQDDITELNEIAKHRPRSTLVLGIAQENRQIRELQHENRELQATLEDHQSALELIMCKYREHTVKLLHGNRVEKALQQKDVEDKNSMCHLMDRIDEMAGVMQKAIEVDDNVGCVDKEKLSRLEVENRALRELLEICTTRSEKILPQEVPEEQARSKEDVAAEKKHDGEEEEEEDTANEDDDDTSSECSSTIMTPLAVRKTVIEEVTDKKHASTTTTGSKQKSPDSCGGGKDIKEKTGPAGVSTGATAAGKSGKSLSPVKSLPNTKKTKAGAVGKPDTGVKKTLSGTVVKREGTLKNSPTLDTKKDLKAKPAMSKTLAKK